MKIKKNCSTGAGYLVGPTMAVSVKQCPYIKVTLVDKNQARVDGWNDSNLDDLPVFELGLPEIVKKTRVRHLFFSTNIDEAEMFFISVNTLLKLTVREKVWSQT